MKKHAVCCSLAAVALCAVCANGAPSKADVAASDKRNWGDAVYTASADPDGKTTVLSDLVAIKNALAREQVYMQAFMGKLEKSLDSSKPEDALAEALRRLSAPLDPVPQRDFSNVQTTKGELTGIKSLASVKNAMGHFDGILRAKVRDALKADIETRVFSRWHRFDKAVEMMPKYDALAEAFEKVDAAWGKYLKLLGQISNGTDKWKRTPEEISTPAGFDKFFDEVLMESGLADFFDVNGRALPSLDRNTRTIDRILKRIDKGEIEEFDRAIAKCSEANNAAFSAGAKEWNEWYAANGLAIDPYPREFLKGLSRGYQKFGHEHYELLEKCEKTLNAVKAESNSLGKLRMCRFKAPNGAFTVRSGVGDWGTPAYTRRFGELGLEAKARFKKAVLSVYKRHNMPTLLF